MILDRRSDFPLLANNPGLIYLDSAASSQKPRVVIDAVQSALSDSYAPVDRSLYPFGVAASDHFAEARATIAAFIGARPCDTILTHGSTDSLNILASAISPTLGSDDEIVVTALEHHSNYLPWQRAANLSGASFKVVEVDEETGEIDLGHFRQTITPHTKIVAVTMVSNVTGTVTPLALIKKIMDEQGSSARLIVDAAQAAAHLPLDVTEIGCDALVFSAHKLYGPSGTGVLWGRAEFLEQLSSPRVGGGTVDTVRNATPYWRETPHRFEAGTQPYESVLGFAAAVSYLSKIGMDAVADHTVTLSLHLREALADCEGVRIIGEPSPQSGIVSFVVEGIHPHDVAEYLGESQICIRAGQHCAGPLHEAMKLAASCRASIGIYTSESDIDRLASRLRSCIKAYGR